MAVKNALLEEIARHIPKYRPDFPQLVHRLVASVRHHHKPHVYSECNFVAHLSELHLHDTLKKICSVYAERICFNPLCVGMHTEQYEVQKRCRKLIIFSRETEQDYSEIDDIIYCDGLPVLFELKLTRTRQQNHWTGRHRQRKEVAPHIFTHPSSLGAHYAMQEARIQQVLDPIKKLTRVPDCGYVLVIPYDEFCLEDAVQQDFVRRQNILVPWYTSRRAFQEEAYRVGMSYKLVIPRDQNNHRATPASS